jgi:protocatechuate 3,4-dioxygenase beta subunit
MPRGRTSHLWLAIPAVLAALGVGYLAWDVVAPEGGVSRDDGSLPVYEDDAAFDDPLAEHDPEAEGEEPMLMGHGLAAEPGARRPAPGATSSVPAVDPGTPVGTVRFAGIVLDALGRPADGVTVVVGATFVTDKDGRFEGDVPLGRHDILFTSEGRGALWLRDFLVDGSATKPVEFNLVAPSTLTVTVERAGAGVFGAAVTLAREGGSTLPPIGALETDVVGKAVFPGLPAGSYALAVLVPQGPQVRQSLRVTRDQRVDVRVPDAVLLSGRVTDAASGVGVANAAVSFTTWGERGLWYEFETTTNGAGTFEVGALRGNPRSFEVRAEGYAPWPDLARQRDVMRTLGPMGKGTPVACDAALVRGAAVEGRVTVDGTQTPVPGLDLLFRPRRGAVGRATTKADGTYVVAALNPEVYEVAVATAGWHASATATVRIPDGDHPPVRLDLAVRASRTLEGVVVRESASPVAGARVWLWAGDRAVRSARGAGRALETWTDASGSWRLVDVPAETNVAVRAAVGAEQATPVFVRTDRPPPGPIRLVVASTVALRGRVVELGSGAPVAGARVRITPNGAPWGRDGGGATTDAEGRFRFSSLIPGPWDLVPARQDYYPAAPRTVEVTPSEAEASVELALDPGLVIGGAVVDEHGRALPGARARVDGLAGDGATLVRRQATCDDRGEFRTTGYVRGSYRLVVRRQGFQQAVVQGLSGGESRLVVRLQPVPTPP